LLAKELLPPGRSRRRGHVPADTAYLQ
jgi:hypothetical protein